MNIKSISNKLTSSVGMQILKTKKHSPAIMFGAGVVGVVATVVLASRATLKLEEIVDDTAEKLEKAQALADSNHPEYSPEDHKKDVAITYVQAVTKIAKLYAPAFVVGAASIGLLTGAHVTLTRRNAGLMAAYAAIEKGFKEYRERVLKEVGPEKEREFRYGVETKEIYSETKEGEPVVEVVRHAASPSIYARFFMKGNPNWEKERDYNYIFIKAQQASANNQLQANGYLLLNDVYDALGLPRTKEGCVVGWLKDSDGDGHVSFGIFDEENEMRVLDFMSGREDHLLLDFNVDGVIYDKI